MPSKFLRPFARPAADPTHSMVRGRGAAVFDADGNRYVDALASLWFCQVGHGRTEIAEAVGEQLASLEAFHCFERFTNPVAEELCEVLTESSPIPGARVFLTSSGSEAVDSAIKLARLRSRLVGDTDRRLILSRHRAYHGVTFGGLTAQGLEANKDGFGPLLPGIVTVDDAALDAALDRYGESVAAVLTEPVQAAGGVHLPPPGFLEHLRKRCDELGALLIFDEIVTGFGRLGAQWAAQRFGVKPDLCTFAKGVTSGYQPLGGVIVGREVLDVLEHDSGFVLRHGHTYSGHPAGARAALVNMDIIERELLAERANHIGSMLSAGFAELENAGLLSEFRGMAGIWAVRLPEGFDAVVVRDQMLAAGVLPRPLDASTLGFCPPLVIEDDDLELCVATLRDALHKSGAQA